MTLRKESFSMSESKLVIQDLAIAVTGRCNLTCEHCLRGDPVDRNLIKPHMDLLFSHIKEIEILTISGGEPSLAVSSIFELLKSAKEHKTRVQNIFLYTNGFGDQEGLTKAYLSWLQYCISCGSDLELSGIALSTDQFHEKPPEESERRLSVFANYQVPYKRPLTIQPVRMGRAKNLPKTRELIPSTFYLSQEGEDLHIQDSTLYMDVFGYLHASCDVSWDCKDFRLMHVTHANFMDELKKTIAPYAEYME